MCHIPKCDYKNRLYLRSHWNSAWDPPYYWLSSLLSYMLIELDSHFIMYLENTAASNQYILWTLCAKCWMKFIKNVVFNVLLSKVQFSEGGFYTAPSNFAPFSGCHPVWNITAYSAWALIIECLSPTASPQNLRVYPHSSDERLLHTAHVHTSLLICPSYRPWPTWLTSIASSSMKQLPLTAATWPSLSSCWCQSWSRLVLIPIRIQLRTRIQRQAGSQGSS